MYKPVGSSNINTSNNEFVHGREASSSSPTDASSHEI